jgi:hypothetical protein
MTMADETPRAGVDVDWHLTTWEGARREEQRRWSRLPLKRIVAALEEMADLDARWQASAAARPADPPTGE